MFVYYWQLIASHGVIEIKLEVWKWSWNTVECRETYMENSAYVILDCHVITDHAYVTTSCILHIHTYYTSYILHMHTYVHAWLMTMWESILLTFPAKRGGTKITSAEFFHTMFQAHFFSWSLELDLLITSSKIWTWQQSVSCLSYARLLYTDLGLPHKIP